MKITTQVSFLAEQLEPPVISAKKNNFVTPTNASLLTKKEKNRMILWKQTFNPLLTKKEKSRMILWKQTFDKSSAP